MRCILCLEWLQLLQANLCESTWITCFFTHIAIGGVFGVGFLREALDTTEKNYVQDIREKFKKHQKRT